MFLGFMLATLGLKLRLSHLPLAVAWMVPVLILAVPIFDTTLVVISRSRRGLIPFASPGKDHTAHRLANLRFGQRGAVLTIYLAGAIFGTLAVTLSRSSLQWPLVFSAGLVLNALAAVAVLEKLPYQRQEGRER
jgi:UDP-GlcNAc:undecaprenyl-phosphate GlcNAc-1-phosphate transferase